MRKGCKESRRGRLSRVRSPRAGVGPRGAVRLAFCCPQLACFPIQRPEGDRQHGLLRVLLARASSPPPPSPGHRSSPRACGLLRQRGRAATRSPARRPAPGCLRGCRRNAALLQQGQKSAASRRWKASSPISKIGDHVSGSYTEEGGQIVEFIHHQQRAPAADLGQMQFGRSRNGLIGGDVSGQAPARIGLVLGRSHRQSSGSEPCASTGQRRPPRPEGASCRAVRPSRCARRAGPNKMRARNHGQERLPPPGVTAASTSRASVRPETMASITPASCCW